MIKSRVVNRRAITVRSPRDQEKTPVGFVSYHDGLPPPTQAIEIVINEAVVCRKHLDLKTIIDLRTIIDLKTIIMRKYRNEKGSKKN